MMRNGTPLVQWRRHTLGALLTFVVVTLTWAVAAATGAPSSPYTAQTSRRYSMMVEELTGSLDEAGTTPTLVSVVEEMSLTLPAKPGAAAAWEGDSEASEIDDVAAEQLTFDEDFDPIWYFVLHRRGFEHLDWSGCGGKWRPEWSIPKGYKAQDGSSSDPASLSEENRRTSFLFDTLRRYLAHHVVCSYSSVSFCGASRERGPASHFQWAAQFVSTLTSSPLSWTEATPRHSRPNGVVLRNTSSHRASGGEDAHWCSYHLVYHDTLCTQHVNPLLNVGRPGRDAQEGLPEGIFKAAFPSFPKYFGTPFQHFSVKATQERRPGNGTAAQPPTVHLSVKFHMSMVAGEAADLEALRDVWSRELPAYARDGRLQVHIGPGGLSQELRAALPGTAIVSSPEEDQAEATSVAASSTPSQLSQIGRSPEVHYEVRTHGKVHGYMSVELYPALALMDAHAGVGAEQRESMLSDDQGPAQLHSFRPLEGDVVRTLLLFPLHLVRPSLHNMESLLGSTRLVHAYTDVFSNTLAVLLETTLTSVHIAAYEAAYNHARQCHMMVGGGGGIDVRGCRAQDGVLLGRFQLFFGWSELGEMPPDDNSNRLVPQPLVVIHRAASAVDLGAVGASSEFDFCHVQRRYAASAGSTPQLDHQDSLAILFEMLNGTYAWQDGRRGAPAAAKVTLRADGDCVYWVRSTVASGTTIPSPDAAMVFNVLSLGLLFSALCAGMLARLTRRLTCRREDLAQFLARECGTTSVK
ncbi:hypothetical protein JKF63_01840 [Porcisia hertigi]|uniref:Uncharacterized protein n=1 Tax=Porcisia hertigi TaxID=2761500 RepID=A0A836H5G9_9TRYP|nr:hypothetical protein JKF63_01840 [Porcisia hertigi]